MAKLKCVYFHIRNDTNTIFYIGMGNSRRPKDKNGRSTHWKSIVKKAGYNIRLVATNLPEDYACKLEKRLIQIHNRNNKLCNVLIEGHPSGKPNTAILAITKQKLSIKTKQYWKTLSSQERDNKLKGIGKAKSVKCNETAEVYLSVSEAANLNNIHIVNLSKHLHGNKKYSQLRGRTYSWL